MRLAFKIPSYILGIVLVVILAGLYVYYFTTLPESELNNWIASLFSSEEDITISVRRVNRDIWDHLMLEGVSVSPRGESRAPTVNISKMKLDYDVVSLIKNRNRYRSLVIDSVSIKMLPATDEKEEFSAGERKFRLPVNASIDRVFINIIDITLSSGENIRLNGLAFSASARNNQLDIDLDNISGQWPTRDIHIYSITGDFSYNINGFSLDGLHIQTSRSSISIEGNTDQSLVNNINITFECNPINLTEIRNLTGVKVEGNLEARGSINGSLSDFVGSAVIDGLFFDRQIEDLKFDYSYSNKALDFENIDGKIFKAAFEGSGKLDFSKRPESFSYTGKVEHLNLVNLGPDLRTDFTGRVEMTGEGLGANSFFMQIDCDLDAVRIEDYYFDEVSGLFNLDLSELEFTDGFKARYKNTSISAAGKMEYDGNIDIRGESDFRDLTDYTGQIFLKNLGGRGNAEFHVTGPTRDFSINASFRSDSCWTYGLEPAELFIDADLKSFISHRVGTVDGRWTGGELYSAATDSGCFRTVVSGDRIFIDSVHVKTPGGAMWFKGNFDGTTVPPVFTVDTLTADIYGNVISSAYPLVFALYDRETEFSRFKLLFGSGSVRLNGVVTTELEMDLDFLVEGFQIRPVLEQIYPERKIEGVLSGNAGLSGGFDNPIFVAAIKVDSIKVDNIFIGTFESGADYADGYLAARGRRLITPKGAYEFSGKLPMNLAFAEVENRFPNDPINLHLTASGERLILGEALISAIDSFFAEYSFDVSFTGNYEKPLISGKGEIKNGFLKTLELETPLTDVSAKIRMENETIHIVEASATVSVKQTEVDKVLKDLISKIDKKDKKPMVRASGTMKLVGLGDFLYDIDVVGENFFFKSDQYDISGIGDFDLKISGPTPPAVSGDIVITKLDMREEFESFYDPEYEIADAAIEDSSLWNLDLDISAQNNIWIKNSEVDAEFKADIHVERNVGILGILGPLEVIRGNYYLISQKFRFESGIMTFQDVASLNPEIDFIVSTRLRGSGSEASITELDLNITGTLFEPRINAMSKSALSNEDVLRLLLERNWVTSGGTQNLIESAGVFVRSIGLDPRTAQGIVEEIEFSAGGGEEEKARFTLAKYIAPDLYLRYSQRLSADNPGRLIGVEYYLNNNFLLKASQGQQDSDYEGISFDINFNYEF